MKRHLTEGTGATAICGAAAKPEQMRSIDQFIHAAPADRCARCLHLRQAEYDATTLAWEAAKPARHLALAIKFCADTVTQGQASIDKWVERFRANPLDALLWASNLAETAAEFCLAREALAFLSGEVNPDYEGDRLACLRDEFTRSLRSKALHQRWNSSSVLSNLAEEAQRVALAKFLDRLDRWVL